MKSVDVIEEIFAANPNLSTVRFFSFSTRTKLQDRQANLGEFESALVQNAVDRKLREGTRFWEALLSGLAKNGASSKNLLAEVFYHQANRDYFFVNRSNVRRFLTEHCNRLLALNSKVILEDGSSLHIPLLDFKLPSTLQNRQLAEDCVSTLGLEGFLLDSGRSYHFIGVGLVAESEILNLLAKFTLLHPISDSAWAAHQLMERSASLRVTAKDGAIPEVIGRIKAE